MSTVDRAACKGCGAAILWVKNERGKPEPFDAKPTRMLRVAGDTDPDRGPVAFIEADKRFEIKTGHLNHFVTCPNSSNFRKKETP